MSYINNNHTNNHNNNHTSSSSSNSSHQQTESQSQSQDEGEGEGDNFTAVEVMAVLHELIKIKCNAWLGNLQQTLTPVGVSENVLKAILDQMASEENNMVVGMVPDGYDVYITVKNLEVKQYFERLKRDWPDEYEEFQQNILVHLSQSSNQSSTQQDGIINAYSNVTLLHTHPLVFPTHFFVSFHSLVLSLSLSIFPLFPHYNLFLHYSSFSFMLPIRRQILWPVDLSAMVWCLFIMSP